MRRQCGHAEPHHTCSLVEVQLCEGCRGDPKGRWGGSASKTLAGQASLSCHLLGIHNRLNPFEKGTNMANPQSPAAGPSLGGTVFQRFSVCLTPRRAAGGSMLATGMYMQLARADIRPTLRYGHRHLAHVPLRGLNILSSLVPKWLGQREASFVRH
jgi:hypothetical protein